MSDQISRPDAIIIGGGIGGLACAVGLTRQGVRVRLYEKSGAFGKVGAGLQLAPNCTRILDNYGLLEEAIELGVVPEHMRMLDPLEGDELTHLDLADVEKRYGFPDMVMHRSDLHGLLLREARRLGVEMITSANCVDYESVPGGARVSFRDGRTDEAEVVIAADGLHSVARRLLVDDEPVNSAYVAYRGAVPFEAVVPSWRTRSSRRTSASLTSAGCAGRFEITHPSGRFHRCTCLCPSPVLAGSTRSKSVRCRFHTCRPVYRGLPRIAATVRSVHPAPVRCGFRAGSAADGHGIPASFSARVIRAALCPASRCANIHRTTGAVTGSASSRCARRPQAACALFGCGPPSPSRYPCGGRVPALLPGLRGHRGGRTGRASPAWRRPRWPRR